MTRHNFKKLQFSIIFRDLINLFDNKTPVEQFFMLLLLSCRGPLSSGHLHAMVCTDLCFFLVQTKTCSRNYFRVKAWTCKMQSKNNNNISLLLSLSSFIRFNSKVVPRVVVSCAVIFFNWCYSYHRRKLNTYYTIIGRSLIFYMQSSWVQSNLLFSKIKLLQNVSKLCCFFIAILS